MSHDLLQWHTCASYSSEVRSSAQPSSRARTLRIEFSNDLQKALNRSNKGIESLLHTSESREGENINPLTTNLEKNVRRWCNINSQFRRTSNAPSVHTTVTEDHLSSSKGRMQIPLTAVHNVHSRFQLPLSYQPIRIKNPNSATIQVC